MAADDTARPTDSGQSLLATIQARTGHVERSERPGWGFRLAGTMLGRSVSGADPWTPEQREKGVFIDMVDLNLREYQVADGRAGRRFQLFGGDLQSSPWVLSEEQAYVALWRVDGKVVSTDDAERARVWQELGERGRAIIMTRFTVNSGNNNGEAIKEALRLADESFCVRG